MRNRRRIGSAMAGTVISCVPIAFLIGPAAETARAQSLPTVRLPKPDPEGWIPIWRGDNPGDFSVYTGGGAPASESSQPAFSGPFYARNRDTLHASGFSGAQLIFKQVFSHYIMEVQLRWPDGFGNSGTVHKVQWNDGGQSNGLPTGIECQGDPYKGLGQVLCLGPGLYRPRISFRGKTDPQGVPRADSTQEVMDFSGTVLGFPGWKQPYPAAVNEQGWVTLRVEVHGQDTTRHFIDGEKVMEYWNPRIARVFPNDTTLIKTLTEGMVSLQTDGSEVWFRGWRIQVLPEDPLYQGLYTPTVLAAPRPVRMGPERYRLGFDGAALSVLSEGRPVLDMAGRRIDRGPAEGFRKP